MEVPATGAAPGSDGADRQPVADGQDRSMRALRARWRTASMAAGWRFPSDWALPEVDAVCAVVVRGGAPDAALAGLGRARAVAGAGLGETLADLAALHAVLARPEGIDGFVAPDVDTTPSRLLRVTAEGWADAALEQVARAEVTDPLTGLPTAAYLRTRLAEVYRQAAREGWPAGERYALLVVAMDFTGAPGWTRLTGMILAADALRSVFTGGESLAVLGSSTVGALLPRDAGLANQAVRLRRELTERLAVDRDLCEVGTPRLRVLRLPVSHDAACATLATARRT